MIFPEKSVVLALPLQSKDGSLLLQPFTGSLVVTEQQRGHGVVEAAGKKRKKDRKYC